LSLIITGFDENGLRWNGMAEVIKHYNEIFKAYTRCDSLIIEYDELVNHKQNTLIKLSNYLTIDITQNEISLTEKQTSFNSMKEQAKKNNKGSSHFREGKTGLNREKLSKYHKIQLRQIIKLFAPDMYVNADKVNCKRILEEGLNYG